MLLRRARTADLPALLDVQQEGAVLGLGHLFPQDRYPFPRAALQARWAAEIADPDVQVSVVERWEGTIEGFAAVRGNQLLHFGTAVPTWGTGLAAAVHDELAEQLAASGEATAWLFVFEQNHRARRFYEKMGWAPTPRLSRSGFPPYPVLMHYELALVPVSADPPSRRTR